MAARRIFCPTAKVVTALDPSAGRHRLLLGETGHRSWNMDTLAGGELKWGVAGFIIKTHRGSNTSGGPIKHDVGKKLFICKMLQHISFAMAPAVRLFQDPRGQTHGRVV